MISDRLDESKALLATPESREFLDAQWDFSAQNGAAHLEEIRGLAEGYEVSPRDLFAYLHLGALDADDPEKDGCSVAAISDTQNGPMLAKNRDFGTEHQKLQRVVLHRDPAQALHWCMFVTSLGSPGGAVRPMRTSLYMDNMTVPYAAPS